MTIDLPHDLEDSLLLEVFKGRFASVDEAIAEAVRLLLLQGSESGPVDKKTAAVEGGAISAEKPIWKVIEEENRTIPPEVWDALPTDHSAQHDHYIYGTPKRTDA